MIKAVIFDLDGVLVNAKEWHYEALNQALAAHGYTIPHEEHLDIFDGLPTRQKLEILTQSQGLPPELYGPVMDAKQRHTMEKIEQLCVPYPPHETALATLRKLGYKLAVASNSSRQTVDTVLRLNKLAPYLEFALSNGDVKKPKPDPEIYTKAIQRVGFVPDECLAIEDNDKGIAAAKASGAHVMIVETIHDVTLDRILKSVDSARAKERA
jgi:HAD superfamily hydrolase (TIGR01509 family)